MKWKKTEQGYLVTTAQIACVGSFEYYGYELGLSGAKANHKFLVHRTADELFSPETIASFEGQTLTLLHPDDDEVTAKTWKQKTIGHLQNARREGDYLACDVYIKDAAAIEVIETLGLREVSAGWEPAELVEVDGQIHHVDMRGNHSAVVPEGRAGSGCRLNDKKGKPMNKFTLANIIALLKGKRLGDAAGEALTAEELEGMIAGLEATLTELKGKDDPETVAKVQEIVTQLAELKTELEKSKTNLTDEDPKGGGEVDVLKEENTQLKARIAELEVELEKLKGDKDKEVTLNDAKARFPKLSLTDSKSARDVRERVLVGIGAFNDSAVKALSDDQVQAAYAAAQVASSPRQNTIGKTLLTDSKPKEKHNLTKQFGGK